MALWSPFLDRDKGGRCSFLPFLLPQWWGSFLHCRRIQNLMREVTFCFYFIDMVIIRTNEAPWEETREGLRTKLLILCGLKKTLYCMHVHVYLCCSLFITSGSIYLSSKKQSFHQQGFQGRAQLSWINKIILNTVTYR